MNCDAVLPGALDVQTAQNNTQKHDRLSEKAKREREDELAFLRRMQGVLAVLKIFGVSEK